MEKMSFDQLRSEFFRFYQLEAYRQAFDLARQWQAETSGQAAVLVNWKLCSATLTGDSKLALKVLSEEMDNGYFWPPEALRGDPDLAAMQGLPEYQRLVTLCGERLEQARQAARPTLTVLPPAKTNGPYPLLLAFHGWGQLAGDFAVHWQSLAENGWIVASAQSSQVIAKDTFVWDNLETAIGEAQKHYHDLSSQYLVDSQRVIVAGFSQGGGVALWLALTQKFPVCGFVGVGPHLDKLAELAPQLGSEPLPGVRSYLVTGQEEQDGGMFATVEETLRARNIPFRRDDLPGMGHAFPPDFPARLQNALAFLLDQ